MPSRQSRRPRRFLKNPRLGPSILVCVIFVIFSRAFSFQQSKIPSGSMEDTLLIGDYIMVNRFVYAPTSFDWEKKLLPIREAQRGDVVVFKFPNEPEVDYIKRVVGVPGDVVEVRSGEVFVNDEPVSEPYVTEAHRDNRESPTRIKVEPEHYFVMGDHRNRSMDSRSWGQVPKDLLKGRALLVWWSYMEGAGDINLRGMDRLKAMGSKVGHLLTRSRWSRCFTLIR